MEIIVVILLGCRTAEDEQGKEYNIEGAANASPYNGTIELDGTSFTIKHGERHKAVVLSDYTVKLIQKIQAVA
jgi:hypothetical protein